MANTRSKRFMESTNFAEYIKTVSDLDLFFIMQLAEYEDFLRSNHDTSEQSEGK